MCVIIDANVAHSVFNTKRQTENGKSLLKWIGQGRPLVVESQLKRELNLDTNEYIQRWIKEGENNNLKRLKICPDSAVKQEIQKLKRKTLKSNDPHIIALARVSGARLLYSKDQKLQEDFKKKEFISQPGGKIYPYGEKTKKAEKFLEKNRSICQSK